MVKIPNEMVKNFGDPKCRRDLMSQYGNSKSAYCGSNSDGEAILISIATTSIQVTTFQENVWVRIDTYNEQGYKESERYDGRWKAKKEHSLKQNTTHCTAEALENAAKTLNPNYSDRHNDIVFASDVCRSALNDSSLSQEIKEKLKSAIRTLNSIACR